MEKFTKIKNKEDNITNKDNVVYDDNYIKVIDFEDWSIVKEKDVVVCIPYFIESNQFIIRQEYVPTYKYVDGQEYHITILSGTIESGETPEETIIREIQEEAGIVLRDSYIVEFEKPLFMTKGNCSKYHCCILPLNENDYHEIQIKTDGSKAELKSKTIKIDNKYINSLNVSDLITEFMLNKLKKYINVD